MQTASQNGGFLTGGYGYISFVSTWPSTTNAVSAAIEPVYTAGTGTLHYSTGKLSYQRQIHTKRLSHGSLPTTPPLNHNTTRQKRQLDAGDGFWSNEFRAWELH